MVKKVPRCGPAIPEELPKIQDIFALFKNIKISEDENNKTRQAKIDMEFFSPFSDG